VRARVWDRTKKIPVRPPIGSRRLSTLITTSSLRAIDHSPRGLSRGVVPSKNERSQGEENRHTTGRPAMGTEVDLQTGHACSPVCCPGSSAIGVRSSPGGGLSPSPSLVQVPQAPSAFYREGVKGTSILTGEAGVGTPNRRESLAIPAGASSMTRRYQAGLDLPMKPEIAVPTTRTKDTGWAMGSEEPAPTGNPRCGV